MLNLCRVWMALGCTAKQLCRLADTSCSQAGKAVLMADVGSQSADARSARPSNHLALSRRVTASIWPGSGPCVLSPSSSTFTSALLYSQDASCSLLTAWVLAAQGAEENGDSSPVQGPLQPGETTPLLLPAPPIHSPSQSPFSVPVPKYTREDQPTEVSLVRSCEWLLGWVVCALIREHAWPERRCRAGAIGSPSRCVGRA